MSITHQNETSRTGPHRRVERLLAKMMLSFDSEESFPPYSVDIYLHEWHIGLEIDGPNHSSKKDAIRDERLREQYFLPILHLPVGLPAKEIIMRVEKFIEEWAESAPQRKHQWRASAQ